MTHERRSRLRTGWALGLLAGGLAALGAVAAHEIAMARQKPIVVLRFLAGYFDPAGRFVPTAGRGATNVDRNAVIMFVCSGAVDMGPRIQATLPLTIAEQGELAALTVELRTNPDPSAADVRRFAELGGDPGSVFEPGVLARRQSFQRAASIVATGSVSAESVQIASVSAGGSAAAEGAFFKVRKRKRRRTSRNRFIFNPRFVVATFNRPGEIDYNPEGFDANTEYRVTIEGGDDDNLLRTVTNLDGLPLARPFATTFRTSSRYVQDFSRPEIVTTSPIDGTPNVPSDQDVEITFSEPMDITSFLPPRFQDDDAATVRVRYSNSAINGALAGRNVLSLVRVKPQTAGNVVQMRPLQTFGRGPYEIEVTITSSVTDLSANDIIRQQQFTFTTAFDPSADFIGETIEDFETNNQQDTDFGPADVTGDNLVADWNTTARPGELSTSVQDLAFAARGPNPGSNVNVWFTGALRWQMLFPAPDMGARPRTITGFSWVQSGTRIDQPPPAAPIILNTQANLTYANTQVKMGHATDSIAGGGFPGGTSPPGPIATNYQDPPITVVRPVIYTIPVVAGGGTGGTAPFNVPGPTFEKNFDFNGLDSVILEVEHFGNGTAATSELWEQDGGYSINALTFSLFQNVPVINQANNWYQSADFTFLSPGAEAQSLWYNTQQPAVRFVPQQIVPFQQPQGTVVAIEWQGGKADINDPSLLDSTTVTPWTTDIRTLATYPFVRWHIELVNNLSTGDTSSVDSLTIPYTYR